MEQMYSATLVLEDR